MRKSFVYTQFQASNSFSWAIERILSGVYILSQSGHGINGNEEVLGIH